VNLSIVGDEDVGSSVFGTMTGIVPRRAVCACGIGILLACTNEVRLVGDSRRIGVSRFGEGGGLGRYGASRSSSPVSQSFGAGLEDGRGGSFGTLSSRTGGLSEGMLEPASVVLLSSAGLLLIVTELRCFLVKEGLGGGISLSLAAADGFGKTGGTTLEDASRNLDDGDLYESGWAGSDLRGYGSVVAVVPEDGVVNRASSSSSDGNRDSADPLSMRDDDGGRLAGGWELHDEPDPFGIKGAGTGRDCWEVEGSG
jgi:hypothetical protein